MTPNSILLSRAITCTATLAAIMMAFALSSAALAQNQKPPNQKQFNLQGVWNDGGDVVNITQNGATVTAKWEKPGTCKYGETEVAVRPDFKATLVGNKLSGEASYCNYGDESAKGMQRGRIELTVSADGNTLSAIQYMKDFTKSGTGEVKVEYEMTRACNNEKLCATLNSAYQSVSPVLDTLNSGGRPSFSVEQFRARLSDQLNTVQGELERCGYRSQAGDIQGVLKELGDVAESYRTDDPEVKRGNLTWRLEKIERSLNGVRVSLLYKGGPCYGMPPSTSGGNPPANEIPSDESPSGGEQPSEEGPCKEGEKPKTAADNVALNRLIKTLQSDINKLQQQARVLRGSRQLTAIKNKIEKLKQMRAFWQQVAAVSCLPPGIPESVRSYLQERQAKGDTADECSQLCSATSAWVEQQTNSNLQMKFSMDGCLASCNK